jgi:probable phosphoglycerate mutase
MTADLVIVEADGGSRGNPGPAGYGAVVLDPATRAILAERSAFIGVATNNVAEYRGLIAGLEAARELGAQRVRVRMDSKLVVEQMRGTWQVKHPNLRPLAREATRLRQEFAEVSFDWIPREQNRHADRLANEAMDAAADTTARAAAAPTRDEPDAGPPSWAPPSGARTRLILVRHGATAHSAEHRFSGRNDLPLNEDGRAQAAALAARRFGNIAAVVTSPLRRARETAEVLADALGMRPTVADAFTELDFGAFEGLTLAELRERFPAELAAWLASPDTAPPDGESFTALARRVRNGRTALIAKYPDANIVVVTHVTPIKMLVRAALDAPPGAIFRMYLDTASVSVVDYPADGSSSLRLFNDTGHVPTTW